MSRHVYPVELNQGTELTYTPNDEGNEEPGSPSCDQECMPDRGYSEQNSKNACGSQGGLVMVELDGTWIYRHYDGDADDRWLFAEKMQEVGKSVVAPQRLILISVQRVETKDWIEADER